MNIGRQSSDQEQAHVTKLVGAPGSGKTTNMLRLLRDELRDGTGLGEILFLTFTRAARGEVEERLIDIADEEGALDDEVEPGRRVRTLHSAALQACQDEGALEIRRRSNLDAHGDLLITRTNDDDSPYFEWFFGEHFPHIEYDAESNDIQQLKTGEWEDESGNLPVGNRIMALYDFLISKGWPVAYYHHAPISEGIELPDQEILDVLREWEAFKDRNDLIQHDDYVGLAVDQQCPPPGSVLFIDEFQDLSPIQGRLYEVWCDCGAVDRVYIAGDPHQAIYGFRGAEPSLFQETPVDEVIHDETSKRCRQEIIDVAKEVAVPVPEHDVSRVDAFEAGGSVEHVTAPSADEVAAIVRRCIDEYNDVFLLARTNRQAGKIAYALREAGLPYLDVSPSGRLRRWKDPAGALLAGARAFNDGDPLPVYNLYLYLAMCATSPERETIQAEIERADAAAEIRNRSSDEINLKGVADAMGVDVWSTVPAAIYRKWFTEASSGTELVNLLRIDEEWLVDLLRGAIEARAEHSPADVRVGTLHAAKGLGADAVLLFPAYSAKQLDRYHNDRAAEAEERRLYYVGLTRARSEVIITHDYHGGEEFPPLAR